MSDPLEENYKKVVYYLNKLFDSESVDKYLEKLCGNNYDLIKEGSYATTKSTGLAYRGSLLQTIFEICDYACKINEILPEEKRVERSDIYRAGILSQLIKAILFQENTNEWEKEKRGIIYTFTDQGLALRMGERAAYYALSSGLDISMEVYEAIRILDKNDNNDNYTKYYSGTLANIIRQATEIVDLIHNQTHL